MIALLFLLLAWLAGYRLLRWLLGDPAKLLAGTGQSPWPALLFNLAASLWAGLLPLTWLVYLLAWLADSFLPAQIHPLLAVNAILMPLLAIGLAWPYLSKARQYLHRLQDNKQLSAWARTRAKPSRWAALIRSLRHKATLVYLMPLPVWFLLGILMMFATFYREGTLYRAGYTVFSDFAPHTALVSSFAEGRNWPTEYPHFANDGISYHFMFFFLCGDLHFLGLPLDWAINLPSMLGLLSFCILLGLLAVQLTGRRAAYLLTPLLLFCRSSLAFFTHLGKLAGRLGPVPDALPLILQSLWRQQSYIGDTPNDSWGLWGVNVYANQRHLLPGLSVVLLILFLMLPLLNAGLQKKPNWHDWLFSREIWLITTPEARNRLIAVLLLIVCLPYFHGSALVALLLFLMVMALFSTGRLAYLIVAAAAAGSAMFQSRLFAGDASAVISPRIFWGFIAPDQSIAGILRYLLEMSGLVLPLTLIALMLPGRRRKVLLWAFLMPLVFAFTVSLTPDVTVNHKFIIISLMFCNIYIADLLGRLWSGPLKPGSPDRPAVRRGAALSVAGKLTAIILAAVLMITGIQEIIILKNASKLSVGIDSASPLVSWIKDNTSPDAVFVTAPYHYNAFYLSGRATWLGHAYYAWSAGHDTSGRLREEQWLVAGCDGDLSAAKVFITENGLDYLIIDDALREHPDFNVNEEFYIDHFPVVASFPQLGNALVFKLGP